MITFINIEICFGGNGNKLKYIIINEILPTNIENNPTLKQIINLCILNIKSALYDTLQIIVFMDFSVILLYLDGM